MKAAAVVEGGGRIGEGADSQVRPKHLVNHTELRLATALGTLKCRIFVDMWGRLSSLRTRFPAGPAA
jgi:hypothetical protein